MKTLSSPISQPSIDKIEIAAYLSDCKNKLLVVTLNKGYMDGQEFVVKSSEVLNISGADHDAIMAVAGDPDKDLCDQMEDNIWVYLNLHGYPVS